MSSALPAATEPALSTRMICAATSAAASWRASAPPSSPAPRMTIDRTALLYKLGSRRSIMARVSLVTGGTRGIGFALPRRCIDAGDTVAMTGSRDETVRQALDALSAKAADPTRVMGSACDVREPAAVEAAVRGVVTTRWRAGRARQQRRRWHRCPGGRAVARRVAADRRHEPERRLSLHARPRSRIFASAAAAGSSTSAACRARRRSPAAPHTVPRRRGSMRSPSR